MYAETAADASLSGIHRYFPEWADRPAGPDAQHESDRNSYLAGGYADEFGYGTPPGSAPAIAPLDGDPELCRLWSEQIGALHPGYPECPKPVDRYGSPEPHAGLPSRVVPRATGGFRVIQVGLRARDRPSHPALRLGVISFIAERVMRHRRLNDVL
jgi:hypothetical protein